MLLRAIGRILLCKYFEVRPLAKDKMSFEDFLFFSSGGHLVQWSRTIAAILDFRSENFSLFRSRSHPVATEQVSAQNYLRFEKRCRKLIFKMVAVVAILDFSIGSFSYFVSHKRANAHHQVSI